MIPRSTRSTILRDQALQNGYDEEFTRFLVALCRDYPDLRFRMGVKYAFRPPRTIVVGPPEANARILLIHELSHALCGHRSFKLDVERLKMETEAWEKARELASQYGISLDEETIQAELDTYRDWLHKKSRCPHCGLTRYQTLDTQYHCPLCDRL